MKRVVLVRTMGPRNAGGALRAALNFGPAELVFVAPNRPSLLVHPEFEQMAHGVPDAARRVRVVATLAEALADCHLAIGFTARAREHRLREDWRAVQPEVQALADDPAQRLALVFGSEESGLAGADADRCQRLAMLATAPEHTSINLALAVGIALSSLYSGHGRHQVEYGATQAEGNMREFLKRHMKAVFAERVARTPAAAEDIAAAIERMFSWAPLENRDVRAWQLVLRALGSDLGPGDFGLRGRAPKARRLEKRARARREAEPGEPAAGAAPDPREPD